jgi:glycosyltransferase involved in cell wall biosynthesis
MTQTRSYTLIVPRVDRTGPTNVAVDIGSAAAEQGWQVTLLYLSGQPSRDDLGAIHEVRRFRLADVFRTRGVVHSHGLRPDLVAWLFTWSPRCVVASTLHGHFPSHLAFDYSPCKVKLAWWVWSSALARFNHRVCISQTMVRHYRRQLPELTFDLAYNFRADGSHDLARPCTEVLEWIERQRAAGRIVLLFAGSLSARKNVFALVQAVLRLPDVALLICGEGGERERIMGLLRAEDNGGRCQLAGHVTNLRALLRMVDALVLPSHAEGLPLVVLEAAREGVPSLMSNVAVHRELARLGFGATFDRHTFSDLGRQASALASDRSSVADVRRVQLWKSAFSPQEGFAQYQQLFLKSA